MYILTSEVVNIELTASNAKNVKKSFLLAMVASSYKQNLIDQKTYQTMVQRIEKTL